ncbi:MAG TPA: transglycosylase SLT domain-containing protein [Longimicrobium sp.]
MSSSPRPRRRVNAPRRSPRRARGRARPLRRPSPARVAAVAALAVLLALLPPTRAVAAGAWGRVEQVLAATRAAEARDRMIAGYARRYGISTELADAIERAARAEGIETELAFRLVRVESAFKPNAESYAGALGLTQVMPATASYLQPGITRAQLLDRDTNLRLGFRYLKELLAVYDGDAEEALTAYNRGPGTVARIRGAGGDPANGYSDLVLGARGGSPVNHVRHDSAVAAAPPPAHELAPARLPAGF